MHFEVESFVDHPRSIVQEVAVVLEGQNIDLGAKNLMGDLVADTSRVDSLPGVSVERVRGAKMNFKGPGRAQILPVERFGDDLAFVSLPRLGAIAGFSVDFDNSAKVVRLIKIDA